MPVPENQRDNYVNILNEQLSAIMTEEDLTVDKAFLHLVLRYYGFDETAGEISDGKNDNGVDYWEISEESAVVFQFKTKELQNGLIDLAAIVAPPLLGDLRRARDVVLDVERQIPEVANESVKKFLTRLRRSIERHKESASTNPFIITVYFAALASDFTALAKEEFGNLDFAATAGYDDELIRVKFKPILIEELLEQLWLASNTDWRDSKGNSRNTISLTVCNGQIIAEPKSLVFYTNAYDLVVAFSDYGYQLFEPNVRCEIRRSKVNKAIKASAESSRGRRDFKHLNNGVTIICDGMRKKGGNPPQSIQVTKPGIINGLQTVTSLHDAFDQLEEQDREHFRKNCEVIVRLHTRNAVKDYKSLVKSTNNQNPMHPRNMKSNNSEQVAFERLFAAKLGWFYERKEGAWLAFKSDHKLWGSLQGYRPDSFRQGNGKHRTVDNHDLAQSWLSFIGYSDQAIHERRFLFEEDKYYDLIFQCRTAKHGNEYEYAFDSRKISAETVLQSPDPSLMLTSYAFKQIAKN